MFNDNLARKIAKERFLSESDRRDSPRFDLPVAIRSGNVYRECFGRLSINGLYFETDRRHRLGQRVSARLVLLGLGREIEVQGTVIQIMPAGGQSGVVVRFDGIPFEAERQIARWLDLMARATRVVAAP